MIGGNMRNIMENRSAAEWNAMMNGRVENSNEEGNVEYSIDDRKKNVYNSQDDERDEVTEYDRRTAERIRERSKQNSVSGRSAIRGSAALRLNRGDYSGVVAKGQRGYELFRKALDGTEIKSRKGEPIIWYHGSDQLFDRFTEGKHKNTDGAVGHYFTSSAQIAYGYAGTTENRKNIYPVGINSKHNVEFKASDFSDNYKIQNKALEIIRTSNKYAAKGVDERFLKGLSALLNRGIKANGISEEVAGKIMDAYISHGVIESVTVKDCKWDVPGQTESNNQIIVFSDDNIVTAKADIWAEMADEDNRLNSDVKNHQESNDEEMFSLNEPIEQKRDLVAVHNLTTEKLEGALELGGMPMPSIAVTKKDIGHSTYGEVSLVFGKDTVDPKNKNNKVY